MSEAKPDAREIAPATARRYLLAVLAGILGSCVLFVSLLEGLDRSGHLPPPAFANSLCADEKLRFLRDRPVDPPNLLVIGSSVAWRHIDGEGLVRMLPGTRPLNAGFCGLRANQTAFVANWMLDRYPTVRHVLMVLSPQDLTRCAATPSELFDREDVDRFVHGNAMRWRYYFKYFDPVSLARAAFTIKDRREGKADFDDLVFTAYGDGPLRTKLTRELGSEDKDPIDPACFVALRSLMARLDREDIAFSVVTTPVHPEWIAEDHDRLAVLKDIDDRLRALTAPDGSSYWNAATEWRVPTSSFTDAIHLRWPAAREFTNAVAQHLAAASLTHETGARSERVTELSKAIASKPMQPISHNTRAE